MYKLEIIDNTISKNYELKLYKWKSNYWWQKEKWHFEYIHILGYNYMSPDIAKGKTTTNDMFNEEVNIVIKRYDISEIHRTTITSN